MLRAVSFPEPTVETVIRAGVLTPHGLPGAEVEFAAMAPGRLVTHVVRIMGTTDADGSGDPVSAADLATLTTAPSLDRAAEQVVKDQLFAHNPELVLRGSSSRSSRSSRSRAGSSLVCPLIVNQLQSSRAGAMRYRGRRERHDWGHWPDYCPGTRTPGRTQSARNPDSCQPAVNDLDQGLFAIVDFFLLHV